MLDASRTNFRKRQKDAKNYHTIHYKTTTEHIKCEKESSISVRQTRMFRLNFYWNCDDSMTHNPTKTEHIVSKVRRTQLSLIKHFDTIPLKLLKNLKQRDKPKLFPLSLTQTFLIEISFKTCINLIYQANLIAFRNRYFNNLPNSCNSSSEKVWSLV